MAINASIITDTAKDATKRMVVNYGAGVFAHTTQDWAKHNVVRRYARNPYIVAGERIATETLRLTATLDDGSALGLDLVLAIPVNPNGTTAITHSAPLIVQQPASKVVLPFSTVQLIVAAISDLVLTYQWYKKDASNIFVALAGQTADTLVLTNVTAANDNGDYRVIVTNANGSTTSSTANILVSAGASGSLDNSSLLEMLPGVQLFNLF